jgi:predicted N-formylglutamate amidohydrolase
MHDISPLIDDPTSLAQWDDLGAVELVGGAATAPLLIVCDHASNHVPAGLAALGLPEDQLARHIAWDIGAATVARQLAGLLGATAVLSRVSRLVIDCNRALDSDTLICPVSDGTVVPGNQNLPDQVAELRVESCYHPYHAAIAAQLERLERGGAVASVIAIHSFTPSMCDCVPRPWQVGVLWNRDPRLAVPAIDSLRARGNLCVGDNQPYSGRTTSYTLDTHGGAPGRPHVSFELRQDEVADTPAAQRWAVLLADVLAPILTRPEMRLRQVF